MSEQGTSRIQVTRSRDTYTSLSLKPGIFGVESQHFSITSLIHFYVHCYASNVVRFSLIMNQILR